MPPKKRDASATSGRNSKRGGAQTRRQPARAQRAVQPPSWRRVGKRALIFAPLMFLTISLLNRKVGFTGHVVQTAFLLAFFLPFSYMMDRFAYRAYQRRLERG